MSIPGLPGQSDQVYSVVRYTGDGSQTNWEFSFEGGYLSQDHVRVAVIATDGSITTPAYTWTGESTLNITPAVQSGYLLTIYRTTPRAAPLADFNDDAIITEATLDLTVSIIRLMNLVRYAIELIASYPTEAAWVAAGTGIIALAIRQKIRLILISLSYF